MGGLRKAIDILLCEIDQLRIVDAISRFGIHEHVRRHSLAQEFHGVDGTETGFAGQHYDRIGFCRLVHYQQVRGLVCEDEGEDYNQEYKDREPAAHVSSQFIGKPGRGRRRLPQ